MKLAMLEYWFMFDPTNTWQHFHQFEDDLAKFLQEHGLEGRIIDSINGQAGKRIMYVVRKESISIPTGKVGRPQTVGGRMKELKFKKITAKARDFGTSKVKGFEKVMRKIK